MGLLLSTSYKVDRVVPDSSPPKSPLPVYVATPICTAHLVLFLKSAGAFGNHRTQNTPRGCWAAQPTSGHREEATRGRVHKCAGVIECFFFPNCHLLA